MGRMRGGVARRSGLLGSSRSKSTSARLRSTNNSVSNNSHGEKLQRIKKELMIQNPVCGCNGRHGCGMSLLPQFYSGIVYADHIVPVSQGGATVKGNIQLLCFKCHANKIGSKNRKGSKLLKAGNAYAMKRKRQASKNTKSGWGDSWKNY